MNVIVFSPHPDDAETTTGGTIAQYTSKGHQVLIVVVTIPNDKETRKKELTEAAAILGAKLSILDIHPYELLLNRSLIEIFDKVIQDFPPDIIYTSWIHDSHQDHVTVAKATIAAARKNTCSLYMYEQTLISGLTPFVFKPQVFVDITDTIEIKRKAILAHKSQVERYGEQWVQGIRGRATYMGFRINVKYAEVFEVVKEIKQI